MSGLSLKKSFALATAAVCLTLPLVLGGCSESPYDQPQQDQQTQVVTNDGYKVELLKSGDFAVPIKDGLYKLTIPGDKLDRDQDVTCVMVKDYTGYQGYMGLSCDFGHAPAVKAPAPR